MGKPKRRKQNTHGTRRRPQSVGSMPCGTIHVTSGGYGFVEAPEGRFFIPANRMGGAMDGDYVRIRPRSANWQGQARHAQQGSRRGSQRAPEAVVERVLDRSTEKLVGTYVEYDGMGFVFPQDKRIDYLVRAEIPEGMQVQEGDIVLLAMQVYPSRRESPSGVVERVIGRDGDPGVIEDIIAARHGIDTQFSQAALEQADAQKLDIQAALREPDRRDIRDRFVLTIDPVDARDFDDALSLDYVDGVMRLGVHIADVSSYVTWGSAVDLDARKRATSVYFPDRVIPMLPESLSNGLCSLNPGEDRLAFTVDIMLDRNCNVMGCEMYPSVICSDLRLDYDSVQQMFDSDQGYPSDQARRVLQSLRDVADRLFAKRIKRGALDFASIELKVLLDQQGNPAGVVKRQRNQATDLVEEAMILANEAVASYMIEADVPMVYRVHEPPRVSSVEEIVPVLREFGYAKDGAPTTNAAIQTILNDVRDKPAAPLVNMLLLRAMKQAVYKPRFTTHFGLASDGYTHFTSPIRRYPDLMAHRLLRRQLFEQSRKRGDFREYIAQNGGLQEPDALKGVGQMVEQLSWLCENSSLREREAERASYDAVDAKVCEYMQQFVGQEFAGIIVNVTQFGFFVQLSNGCEGLVPVRLLDGWFEYDDAKRALQGTLGGKAKTFKLGQPVRVVLDEADPRKGELTFKMAR